MPLPGSRSCPDLRGSARTAAGSGNSAARGKQEDTISSEKDVLVPLGDLVGQRPDSPVLRLPTGGPGNPPIGVHEAGIAWLTPESPVTSCDKDYAFSAAFLSRGSPGKSCPRLGVKREQRSTASCGQTR
jgi:hypothetical protein